MTVYDAALRIDRFIEAWKTLYPNCGLIYGIGINAEDKPRDLLIEDLETVLRWVA